MSKICDSPRLRRRVDGAVWRRRRASRSSLASHDTLVLAAALVIAAMAGRADGCGRARDATDPGTTAALPQSDFSRLTLLEGTALDSHISPDGKWVVYVSAVSGNNDIYLQSTTGQTPINLTKDSPVADTQPAFSPQRRAHRLSIGARRRRALRHGPHW